MPKKNKQYRPVRAHGNGCKPRHLAHMITRTYHLEKEEVTGSVVVTLCNKAMANWVDVVNTSYNYSDGSPFMTDCPICLERAGG